MYRLFVLDSDSDVVTLLHNDVVTLLDSNVATLLAWLVSIMYGLFMYDWRS